MREASKPKQRVVRRSPSRGPGSPEVWGVHEPDTGSVQCVAACPATRQAALIDVVRDFDPRGYAAGAEAMGQVLDLVAREGLTVAWVLDTHPHADHPMASARLKERTGAPAAIGAKLRDIAAPGARHDPSWEAARNAALRPTLLRGPRASRRLMSRMSRRGTSPRPAPRDGFARSSSAGPGRRPRRPLAGPRPAPHAPSHPPCSRAPAGRPAAFGPAARAARPSPAALGPRRPSRAAGRIRPRRPCPAPLGSVTGGLPAPRGPRSVRGRALPVRRPS